MQLGVRIARVSAAALALAAAAGLAPIDVAGRQLADVQPSQLDLASNVAGAVAIQSVEFRNIGNPGTINWTATVDQLWLSVSPGTGSATDVAPSTIDITANPTGLAAGLYSGTVTLSHDAPNTPLTVDVAFAVTAVAGVVPIDETVTTSGTLALGERLRYQFSGTAGQEVDIALLTNFVASSPLTDPLVRLYAPDGVTLLNSNDDAFFAGLGLQSLMFGQLLAQTGTYFIEVGAFDDADFGTFDLKVRPTGPIVGIDPEGPADVFLRAEENGAAGQATFQIINLTGVGTLGFTLTPSDFWLTANPNTGTAGAPAQVAAAPSIVRRPAEPSAMALGVEYLRRHPDAALSLRAPRSQGLKAEFRRRLEMSGAPAAAPALAAPAAAALASLGVTLSADPTGLLVGDYSSGLTMSTDPWLLTNFFEFLFVNFRVYTAGMEVTSVGHDRPEGIANDGPGRAVATDRRAEEIFPIDADGVVGPTIASGLGFAAAGVTTGLDGNWYVGVNNIFNIDLFRVFRDGLVESFATLPSTPFFVTTGPSGSIYATLPLDDAVYRVSADGAVVEAFGPFVSYPFGIAYNPFNSTLYVVQPAGGIRVIGLDGTDLGTVATNVLNPRGIAVGSSGLVYIGTSFGEVWVYDPSGVPLDATLLALAPTDGRLYGMAVVDGALLLAGDLVGEFYRFPVADGAPGIFAGDVVAQFVTGAVDAVEEESLSLPFLIDLTTFETTAASYSLKLNWNPEMLTFEGITAGDFTTTGGSFAANTESAAEGSISVAAAEPTGVGGGAFTLFTLDLRVNAGLARGQTLDVTPDAFTLEGPLGENLLTDLTAQGGAICVSPWVFGDITDNTVVSGGDVVQLLRSLVGLPLTAGADIGRADVTGDGSVGVGDAVEMLRYLVDLPVAPGSRLNRAHVTACP